MRLLVSSLAAAVVVAPLLTTGSAAAEALSSGCTHAYSYNNTRVTVHCDASPGFTTFAAVAYCPNVTRFGPFVPLGGDHVSVATCANPMSTWGVAINHT
jgi:hypothetical protein